MTSVIAAPRVDMKDRTCRENSPLGWPEEASRRPGIDYLAK